MSPKRVEGKIDILATIAGKVGAIFRPVCGIGNLCGWPDNGAHITGKLDQRVHERIVPRRVAQARQAPEFRAKQHRLDAASRPGQHRHVQGEATIAPVVVRAAIGHKPAVKRKVVRLDLPHEGRDCIAGQRAAIGKAGDPATPGKRGLLIRAIRIGQAIAGRHVHEQEGRDGHIDLRSLQRFNRLDHRSVGRSAAIIGLTIGCARHEKGICAARAANFPLPRNRLFLARFDAGPDQTVLGAQVATEPAHCQRRTAKIRKGVHQLVERDEKVGPPVMRVRVDGAFAAGKLPGGDHLGGVDELA